LEVWVMNADGSGQKRLTSGSDAEGGPIWSPDGRTIAFEQAGELYRSDAQGTSATRLTTTHPAEAASVAETRDARSGAAISSFSSAGAAQAVALSPSLGAVLVKGFFGERVELYDPRSGAPRGTVPVPPTTAPEISIAGGRIVFRTGRKVQMLDAASRKISPLAVAGATPIGLSIEGRRVAWAENSGGHGRIRAVKLGRG
jgi:WD40-like Beta Propeller Repeat